MADRRRAEQLGHRAEFFAAMYLRMKGYRILGRRIKTTAGEIDIIARRGRLIAFVEVKARSHFTLALESVTQRSQRRISRAAGLWAARRPETHDLDWRFDIVAVVPYRWPHHARDAWRPTARH